MARYKVYVTPKLTNELNVGCESARRCYWRQRGNRRFEMTNKRALRRAVEQHGLASLRRLLNPTIGQLMMAVIDWSTHARYDVASTREETLYRYNEEATECAYEAARDRVVEVLLVALRTDPRPVLVNLGEGFVIEEVTRKKKPTTKKKVTKKKVTRKKR